MTIEQLCGMSANELETMILAEKEEFFKPYLQFIRPSAEVVEKQKFEKYEKPTKRGSSTNRILNQGQALLLEMEKRMKNTQ